MLARRRAALAILLASAALGLGLAPAACLRAFGPDLRARGPHAELDTEAGESTCLGCHESESAALARTRVGQAAASEAPLVADWMISDDQPCHVCHRIRGHGR